MANRILRDWTDSEKVDQISYQAEVLFTRLFMKADDYGSFFASPKLLRPQLFPLRVDKVREADISRWMHELQTAGLIALYEADSKQYLRIVNFGQRLRTMKKRFPDLPINSSRQSAAIRRELRLETETETEVETEKISTNVDKKVIIDEGLDDVPEFVKKDREKALKAKCEDFDFAKWHEDLMENYQQKQIVELAAKENKSSLKEVKEYVHSFYYEKSATGECPKSTSDANKWFLAWLRKRITGEKQDQPKGKIARNNELTDLATERILKKLNKGVYDVDDSH